MARLESLLDPGPADVRTLVIQGLLLTGLVGFAFYPCLDNPPWDDTSLFLIYFPTVHHSLRTIFDPSTYDIEYRPLLHLFNRLIYSVTGRDFTLYHAIRIALHLVNVLLVYRFAAFFLRPAWYRFFAAALYAVHPGPAIRVIETAPSSFMTLAPLVCFIAFVRSLGGPTRSTLAYGVAVASFGAGISMREELYYLLVVLPLYEWWFARTTIRQVVLRQIPFWLIAGGYLLFKLDFESRFVAGAVMSYGLGAHVVTNLLDYFAGLFFPHIGPLAAGAIYNLQEFDPSAYFIVSYIGDLWPNDPLHIAFRVASLALIVFGFAWGSRRLRFCLIWVGTPLLIFLPLSGDCSASYLDQSSIAFGVAFLLLAERLLALVRVRRATWTTAAVLLVASVTVAIYTVQIRRAEPLWEVEGIAELYETEGRWDRYKLGPITSPADLERAKRELTELYYRDAGTWPAGVNPRRGEVNSSP